MHTMLTHAMTAGFNQKLQINDSLLAQSYIEAYDISYPEAMSRINDDVNELKQRIENEGSYALNGIGVLSYNENGSYRIMKMAVTSSSLVKPASLHQISMVSGELR